jgi:hypothetical protein
LPTGYVWWLVVNKRRREEKMDKKKSLTKRIDTFLFVLVLIINHNECGKSGILQSEDGL